jgi:hypothetical protein
MPEPQRLMTKDFIRDVLSLDKRKRKLFETRAQRLLEDIHQFGYEKLRGDVNGASAYSNQFVDGWRFIWTSELHPDILFRVLGPHDPAYRKKTKLGRVRRSSSIRPLSSLLKVGEGIVAEAGETMPRVAWGGEFAPVGHSHEWLGGTPEPLTASETSEIEFVDCEGEEVLYSATDREMEALLSGNIAAWMLFLAPEQERFTRRVFNGPARVVGPAGSGKTAVLLHRAKVEAEKDPYARVMVLCFNVTLKLILDNLLNRLCSELSVRERIRVRTVDDLAREVADVRQNVLKDRGSYVQRAVRVCGLIRLPLLIPDAGMLRDLLLDEIAHVLKGYDEMTEARYLAMKMSGPVALGAEEKREVYAVWRAYESLKGAELDFEDIRLRALSKVGTSWYNDITAVLVDEYQDLSPVALKLIMEMARKSGNNAFFCGDEQQRLYAKQSSFLSLGIDVRGNSIPLPRMHRNTLQISVFGQLLLEGERADAELDATVKLSDIQFPDREGPQPVIAGFSVSRGESELDWVVEKVLQLIRDGYLPGDCLVLTPNWEFRTQIHGRLTKSDIPAIVFNNDTARAYFAEERVKVSTIHQAKGLESKIVICMGASGTHYKREFRYQGKDGHKKVASLLHVACTRARDLLFITFTGSPLRVLCRAAEPGFATFAEDARLLLLKAENALNKQPIPPVNNSLFVD